MCKVLNRWLRRVKWLEDLEMKDVVGWKSYFESLSGKSFPLLRIEIMKLSKLYSNRVNKYLNSTFWYFGGYASEVILPILDPDVCWGGNSSQTTKVKASEKLQEQFVLPYKSVDLSRPPGLILCRLNRGSQWISQPCPVIPWLLTRFSVFCSKSANHNSIACVTCSRYKFYKNSHSQVYFKLFFFLRSLCSRLGSSFVQFGAPFSSH